MGGNGCPVCGGIGKVLALGTGCDPIAVACPECAGLAITPASADDYRAAPRTASVDVRDAWTVPALPPASVAWDAGRA